MELSRVPPALQHQFEAADSIFDGAGSNDVGLLLGG